jgi:FAS-associated factor 2
LPFFEGGYTQALDKAKDELKYLIVVLQSEEHDLTAPFVKDVLLGPQVVELLKRDDVILWAGNVSESEAYLVASGLDVTKFPFACLIAPAPKTPTSTTVVMSVLAKAQGTLSADEFVTTIEEKMEAHQPKLLALVLDRQERQASQRLREEQDAAYERSLAADRARAAAAREAQVAADAARRAEEAATRAREDLAAKRESWRLWRSTKLPPEPPTGDAAARIGIRLQDGRRVIRRFGADATLEDIYAFVECNDLIGSEAAGGDSVKPDGYKHVYNFSLVSPMPRRVLPVATTAVSDEKAVWPNGSLVVEENDEQ